MDTHQIAFQGKQFPLSGKQLKVGDQVPDFKLTGTDMIDFSSADFLGKPLIIAVVPSIDTPHCSIETKRFDAEAAKFKDKLVILSVSMDLPFAQKRWCTQEGVSNIVSGSDFRIRKFGETFGVTIADWGILSRAVFVADKSGKLVYVEYCPEVSQEPEYEAAIAAAEKVL